MCVSVSVCVCLTGDGELCGPSHQEASKLDLAGVVPDIVLLHLLDGQDVSLLDDAGAPLLGTALLQKQTHLKFVTCYYTPERVLHKQTLDWDAKQNRTRVTVRIAYLWTDTDTFNQ